jgi:hypothetical protein
MTEKKKKYVDFSEKQKLSWIKPKKNKKINSENNLLFNNKKKIQLHNDNNIFERYHITEKINNNHNIDISRSSVNTRLENNNFRKTRETMIENRFQFLTKNFQDPNHLILPFARGGEITRSKEDDEHNTLVTNNNFKFKY